MRIRWRLRWLTYRRLQKMDTWMHRHAQNQQWWRPIICDAYDRRNGWSG